MKTNLKKETEQLIQILKLNCTIKEFSNKVNWGCISESQKLSEEFISKYADKVNIKVQKLSPSEKSLKQKTIEAKKYAKKYNLKITKKYLYAFRNHDFNGCGIYNKIISYEKGQYYTDWHCDMNSENEDSFGLGIFPKGNTAIKVKISDWGVSVNRNDGKARVWGFQII